MAKGITVIIRLLNYLDINFADYLVSVNPLDPVWQAQYNKFSKESSNSARFRDWETLEFLFQSLANNTHMEMVQFMNNPKPEWKWLCINDTNAYDERSVEIVVNALDKHFSKKYDDEYEDDDFTFEDFDESRDFLIFKLNKLHESNRINKKTFKKLFKVLKEVKLGCWGIARNGKLMAYSYEDDTEAKEAKKKLEKDFPKETFEVASPEDIDNGVYKDPVASESAARGDKLGKSFSKIIK